MALEDALAILPPCDGVPHGFGLIRGCSHATVATGSVVSLLQGTCVVSRTEECVVLGELAQRRRVRAKYETPKACKELES